MTVKAGDNVVLIYNGYLQDGEVFDSSKDSGPLSFQIGTDSVLPEFEKQIIGMSPGEEKAFELQPEMAHGPSNPDLIHTMERTKLPNHSQLEPGTILGLTIEKEGQEHQVPATIIALEGNNATVDFNHPLAGKVLKYEVTLQTLTPGQLE